MTFVRSATGEELSRQLPGGVVSSRAYDNSGRPTQQRLVRRSGAVSGVPGTTGGAGGLEELARTDSHWQGEDRLAARDDAGLGTTRYVHDARGRLAGAVNASGREQWRAPGRTGNVYRQRSRSDRRYGAGGVLLEADGVTYGYDEAGNRVEKRLPDGQIWKYAWTSTGRLRSVTRPDGAIVEFGYDALGRRLWKRSGGETIRWQWDGHVPVHEWRERKVSDADAAGGGLTTWLFEPESFVPAAKRGEDGRTLSVVTDYLGTPREMVDEAGHLAWQAQLDVYGVAACAAGQPEDCPWRWQGQYEDVETGLYYNGFRYFDPGTGTYLSHDPIRIAGGYSLYGYVDDPLIWVDPLGLSRTCRQNGPAAADRELPRLDAKMKVHNPEGVDFPAPRDLARFPREDLQQLLDELVVSVRTRIALNATLGADPGHAQRQAIEQQMIKSISKILSS